MSDLIGTKQVVIAAIFAVPPGMNPQAVLATCKQGCSIDLNCAPLLRQVVTEVQDLPLPGLPPRS